MLQMRLPALVSYPLQVRTTMQDGRYALNQRKQWDQAHVDSFVEGLRDVLASRLGLSRGEIMAASNRRLCWLYESLSGSQKYDFWTDVATHMGDRTNREVAKHYHNSFKQHLYSAKLTDQDKAQIRELLRRGLREGRPKRALVLAVVTVFRRANGQVFLQEIKSFIYQELKRIAEQEEVQNALAAPEAERDTDDSSADSQEDDQNSQDSSAAHDVFSWLIQGDFCYFDE